MDKSLCCGPGYSSPLEAMKAPREKVLYTIAIYTGTGIQKPDYLVTIDCDPESVQYGQVIHRLEMPGIGDELHHMGWNACSSCHGDASKERRFLIVPGVRTSNLHIVDCKNQKEPKLHLVVSGEEIKEKTNLSAPHTVHCLGSEIIISMLGNAKGHAPGGYLHLNGNFDILGRWENSMGQIKFGYDFWYQPRHNVMVSSEWAAPNTFMPGFDLEEVGHLKYGREIHFWDFKKREPTETFYLGEDGLVPLEVRFHHDPSSSHGFVGAALSANIIHWWKDSNNEWKWEKINGRNKKVLGGAIAEVDKLMNEHGLDSEDVISQIHEVVVGRRISITDELRCEILDALADCDKNLNNSMHARIPLEQFLHRVAKAGRSHGLAFS